MSKLFVFLVVIAVALSCSTKTEKKENLEAIDAESAPTQNELVKGLTEDGDSVTLSQFEINIELSKKAEKKLANDNETIIVQAYLSGTPKDNTPSLLVDEMGEMNLGSKRIELSKPGIAVFKNIKVSRKMYDELSDPDFQVLINVFSGRKSTDVNLLECDILQEPVTKLRAKKFTLKGKLIRE